MADQELKKAQVLFKRRKFSTVISMLEPRVIDYRDSFDFFYMLGVSCLYMGDMGAAKDYFHRCETIGGTNVPLMVAQAAMFLRRGDTNQAVETYLNILDYEPGNKIASRAMTFIRTKGDMATISQWVSSGKIKRFYPDPGFYFPVMPVAAVLVFAAVVFLSVFLVKNLLNSRHSAAARQGDFGNLELSVDEKKNPLDLQSGVVYNTILTSDQIIEAYDKAKDYFFDHRDNEAQVEINRILNSNAKDKIRDRAKALMEYLEEPSFDTLSKNFKNFTYDEVKADPILYQDCWVIWSGRVTNVRADDSFYECDLLVGYEDWKRLEGVVSLSMQQPVDIDAERPVQVLAKIEIRDNKVLLTGKSYTQSIFTANQ